MDRFLKDPGLPMLLCIGRPVPGKNLQGLVQAYGEDPDLRRLANLVLVAGNRKEIRDLDKESRNTWKELLLATDQGGHTALHAAAGLGNEAALRVLIEAGGKELLLPPGSHAGLFPRPLPLAAPSALVGVGHVAAYR